DSKSSRVASPSAYRSVTATAFLLLSSVRRCQIWWHTATPNSRRFRQLSLLLLLKNSIIGSGSVQANHSASVTVFTPLVPSVIQLEANPATARLSNNEPAQGPPHRTKRGRASRYGAVWTLSYVCGPLGLDEPGDEGVGRTVPEVRRASGL